MTRYGFEQVNLNRLHAFYMTKNPASGRIMQKTGMTFEGTLRKRIKK
jgi:ribosomal-protein-alanine N-acetyltransferase